MKKQSKKMTEKSKTDLKTTCQAAEIGKSRERIHPEKLGGVCGPFPLNHLPDL